MVVVGVRRVGGRRRLARGVAVEVAGGLDAAALTTLQGFAAAVWWGDSDHARAFALALADRPGPILPLVREVPDASWVLLERHVCIDTTASGGNAQLLVQVAG